MAGKAKCESEACGEGSDGNRNLFATSFCLNICKKESWMGERMLTCWRDLIQRMSVGVAVGSSVSCHILMNKRLYRKLFFFLCQRYYFFKSWMIYSPCDRDGTKKINMWCLFTHCWIPFRITLTSLWVCSDKDPHWHISDKQFDLCPSLHLSFPGCPGFSSSGCLRSPTRGDFCKVPHLLCRTINATSGEQAESQADVAQMIPLPSQQLVWHQNSHLKFLPSEILQLN